MSTSNMPQSSQPKVSRLLDSPEHLEKATSIVIDEMTDVLDDFSNNIIHSGPSTFFEEGVREFSYEGDPCVLHYCLGAQKGKAIAKLFVSIPSLSLHDFEIIDTVVDKSPEGGMGRAIDQSITKTRNDAFPDDVDHVISYSVMESLNAAYELALIRSF